MTNVSRRYYERELGAGLGPSPSLKEHFGYSEPLRRFIQRASFSQANEIPNQIPSWLPGDDYMTNFRVGDPYVQIDDGYARLPGAGYEALHPELQGLRPEDYPDIHKLRILSDVAPYSREYNQVSPSCRTQKLSRTRVPGRSSVQDQAQRSGSALVSCRLVRSLEGGQTRVGTPSCRMQKLSRTREQRGCQFHD